MLKKILLLLLILLTFSHIEATPFKFGVSGSKNWFEADESGTGYNLYGFGGIGITPQFYILLSKGFSEFYPNNDSMHTSASQLTLNGRYYFRDPECLHCSSSFFEFGGGIMTSDIFPKSRFTNDPFDDYILHAGLGFDMPVSKHFSLTLIGRYNYTTCDLLDGVAAGEFKDGFYELNLGLNLNLGSIFSRKSDLEKLYKIHKVWPLRTYPEDRFVNNVPLNKEEYEKVTKKLEKRIGKLEKQNKSLEQKLKKIKVKSDTKVDTVIIEKHIPITTPPVQPEENIEDRPIRRVNTIEDIPLANTLYCEPCHEDDEEPTGEIVVEPNIEEDLNTFLSSWTDAWTKKDINRYIAHYSPFFKSYNKDLHAYYLKKQKNFRAAGNINIIIKDIQILNRFDDSMLIRFNQYYKADNMSDFGVKKMLLDTEDGYKIINESWYKTQMPSNFLNDSF